MSAADNAAVALLTKKLMMILIDSVMAAPFPAHPLSCYYHLQLYHRHYQRPPPHYYCYYYSYSREVVEPIAEEAATIINFAIDVVGLSSSTVDSASQSAVGLPQD